MWITLRAEAEVIAEAEALEERVAREHRSPVWGTLLAVKDNVDVAGLPTTAACPAFAYTPTETAPGVARLLEAGALVLGKTNMDQFATGLVGTRSPHGPVRNAWLPGLVAGGSSSGSAVAVALGIADIGVGTDTAGSGRIPAAFQGIVGFKPTRGTLPGGGVVPASRSFDCLSVFSRTVAEAQVAAAVMGLRRPGDPPERIRPRDAPLAAPPSPLVAIPLAAQLVDMEAGWQAMFEDAVGRLALGGARVVRVDIEPFMEGSRMLYHSALLAERYAAVGGFIDAHPGDVDATVRTIIGEAKAVPAHRLVEDVGRLEELRVRASETLDGADVLLLPTSPLHPTMDQVASDPIAVNNALGIYASFANPFDMAAVSVPASLPGGPPFGVTVFARAFADRVAADIARVLFAGPAGPPPPPADGPLLMVVGAHLSGQPLNRELSGRGARLCGAARTAPLYRLFALDTDPPKPGLVHVQRGGVEIQGELWQLPGATLEAVVTDLPEPLAIGPVKTADGATVLGFLCQPSATAGQRDISAFGGWRGYLEATALARAGDPEASS